MIHLIGYYFQLRITKSLNPNRFQILLNFKKRVFLIKIFMSYFLVKTVLKNLAPFKINFKKRQFLFLMFKTFLCYNHVSMKMIFLCVRIMTNCVKIFSPLKKTSLDTKQSLYRFWQILSRVLKTEFSGIHVF
jgi:hypothetical protein